MWLGRRVRNLLEAVSRRVSNLSRRDKRTQPGVSTPGTDKKMSSPAGAVCGGFALPNGEPDLKLTICRPFRACSWVGFIPGVKTPGLVLLSLRDKSDTSRKGDIFG
jgi:hypothetical protein